MRPDQDPDSRIDQICLRFEDALRDGRGHSIEECLPLVDPETRADLLRELLLLELDYSNDPPDADSIIDRFPKFEETIRECLHASNTLAPHRLQEGERVGRYLIQEVLGEGEFGTVYKAWDEKLQRSVAIKSPRLSDATSSGAEGFQREAIALAKLRHINIVVIHDVLSDKNDWPLLVLEHVDAQPLDVRCEHDELVKHLSAVARAMDYVHQQGIVHRDLKPQNILIDSGGRTVVADFGLSIHTKMRHEQRGESAGTIRYMSPELVRGESHWADGRADIWSLGVILYEALAGAPPFAGDDYETVAHAILQSPVRPPRQSNPACQIELEEICLKCLRKEPEDRFATAGDLAAALGGYHRRPERGLLVRRLVYAAAVASLGLLLALAYAFRFQGDSAKSDSPPAAAPPAVRAERIAAFVQFNVVRDGADGLARLRLEAAVPLQDGDRPEIWVQTNQPCRLWVVWIDSTGTVHPIYPWADSSWDSYPPSHEAVADLDLSTNWALRDLRPGSETLLVLGSTSETTVDVDVRSLVRGWKPQTKQLAAELYYDFGMPIQSTLRTEFDYDPKLAVPLLENQRMFREQRFQQFALCRSICIPVGGAQE